MLVGRATRAQRFLMALPKTYVVTARFGATSTTGDPEGEIAHTGVLPPDPLTLPVGELRQRPPAYSAVKVDGERAYRRARRGEEVETAERTVTVHRFEQLWREGDRAEFEIECSSGTYVRSLIADLGDAYCESCGAPRSGPFAVGAADRRAVVPLADALAFLPERRLEGDEPPRAAPRRGGAGRGRGGHVRLTDARRADRDRRAARTRHAQARRRLPRMKVTQLPEVEPRPRRVAVGEFDGVHLGHREVIRGADTVLTFDPHPLAVIHPEAAPKLLTSLDRSRPS